MNGAAPVVSPGDAIRARFGQNLRRRRRRIGLSQEEVGIRASLHRTEIGLLERGERLPRVDTLAKLAGALELPPGDLLIGVKWNAGYARPGEFDISNGQSPVEADRT